MFFYPYGGTNFGIIFVPKFVQPWGGGTHGPGHEQPSVRFAALHDRVRRWLLGRRWRGRCRFRGGRDCRRCRGYLRIGRERCPVGSPRGGCGRLGRDCLRPHLSRGLGSPALLRPSLIDTPAWPIKRKGGPNRIYKICILYLAEWYTQTIFKNIFPAFFLLNLRRIQQKEGWEI